MALTLTVSPSESTSSTAPTRPLATRLNVQQTVLVGRELDERAERLDVDDLALVLLASLGHLDDVFHHLARGLGLLGVDRRDEDVAVLVHLDGGAGLLLRYRGWPLATRCR